MDQLPSFGTAIADVVPPTFKAFYPLIVANAEAIRKTARGTHSYGSHPRQKLDVYRPSKPQSSGSASPILVFLYGGGLIRGEKVMPQYAEGLVHCNVGHFFAEQYGFTTVIPDYRLISHGARYPSGGEDLALVVDWMFKNLSDEGNRPRDLFMMGNSAGGIHLSTYLLAPEFAGSREKVMRGGPIFLKAAVLLSVPFNFDHADATRFDVLETFYGSDIKDHCPVGLLRSAAKANGTIGPFSGLPVLVLNGDLDPEDEILTPKNDFLKAWDEVASDSIKDTLTVDMMKGQNHIAPPLSLGTGRSEEEAWGHQVGEFGISLQSK